MHIHRFNSFPAGSGMAKRAAIHKAARAASARREDEAKREFTRLCGAIIILAEEGREVSVDALVADYGFRPTFLQTHGRRAADKVAKDNPALADAVGHMKGAQ